MYGWIVAALVVVLAACTPSPAARSGPVLASVAVGSRAGTPAVGLGAVWVPNTGDGTVSRIDPGSNRTVATFRVGDAGGFYQRVCQAYGSVHSYMVTSFHVRRCDLPSSVATGNGLLWVTKNDSNEILALDPKDGHQVASVPIGIIPFELTASDQAVWVTSYDDNFVVRIDARSKTVLQTIALPGGPSGLALDGDTVWIANSRAGTVARIDARSNRVVATIAVPCSASCWSAPTPLPVAVANGAVWVRNEGIGTMSKIDPASNTVTTTLDVNTFNGRSGEDALAVAPTGIWLGGVSVEAIDPASDRVARTIDQPGITLAYGYGSLWVTDMFGHILRIDPQLATAQ
jgi:DNA-binding beta-propeller fold protein YncE